jgi:hypothetical protein
LSSTLSTEKKNTDVGRRKDKEMCNTYGKTSLMEFYETLWHSTCPLPNGFQMNLMDKIVKGERRMGHGCCP